VNLDLFDQVTLADIVDHFQSINHFAKASVIAVEVGCVLATVADEKL